jgi:hypothetical protein
VKGWVRASMAAQPAVFESFQIERYTWKQTATPPTTKGVLPP